MIPATFKKRRPRMVSTYVALGDSFTAGNGCEPADRWADLVAAELLGSTLNTGYFNLARDGADSQEVLTQVPEAVRLQPDLVTLVCGANDVILNFRPDINTFRGRFELMLDRLRRWLPGVSVLTATYPEAWNLEGIGPRTRSRIRAGMVDLNQAIREVSAGREVPCLDVVDHPGVANPENFEADGLHPSPAGHQHAALEFRRAIGQSFSIESTSKRREEQWK